MLATSAQPGSLPGIVSVVHAIWSAYLSHPPGYLSPLRDYLGPKDMGISVFPGIPIYLHGKKDRLKIVGYDTYSSYILRLLTVVGQRRGLEYLKLPKTRDSHILHFRRLRNE